MRIAIAWEDAHFHPLERVVLSRRAALRPASATVFVDLVQYTLRGNGRFADHVESKWPRVRTTGSLTNPGPIAHLICVVDADRLHDLLPGVGPVPQAALRVDAWHASAERIFHDHLRARAAKTAAPPETVHGIALRWAKESLALAAYDRAPIKEKLGIEVADGRVQAFLASCVPPPDTVSEGLFTNTY